jgi:hypothetical protein
MSILYFRTVASLYSLAFFFGFFTNALFQWSVQLGIENSFPVGEEISSNFILLGLESVTLLGVLVLTLASISYYALLTCAGLSFLVCVLSFFYKGLSWSHLQILWINL